MLKYRFRRKKPSQVAELSPVLEPKMGVRGAIVLGIMLVFILLPLYWLFTMSIKPLPEWRTYPPVIIPNEPTLENYLVLFGLTEYRYGFIPPRGAVDPLIHSLIIAGLGTALSIIAGLLAALGISRHKIGGSFLPLFILSARMIPPITVIIPILVLYSFLGLLDTMQGLIFLYGVFTVPYSMWMLKSFIDDVPRELEEVAIVEGMSRIGAHLRVTVPLIKGGIAATTLFVFILNWSEFLFALILSSTEVVTIPLQLSRFHAATAGVLYGIQAALGVLATIPLIILGYSIKRYLVRGFTFGAIKR